jgi:acetyl-CoA synthetase
MATNQEIYQQSINNPQTFWAAQAKKYLTWIKPWNHVFEGSFEEANVTWFGGGQLNVCYNCVDRHLASRGNTTALIWQGNEPDEIQTLTYFKLHRKICQFANVLKQHGIKKGDRVCIYLPMIPEAMIAMLACARIGAVHSVVFAGFSAESLRARLLDAECSLLITANEALRGEKKIPLKNNADLALLDCPAVHTMIIVQRTTQTIDWVEKRDHWYHEEMANASTECPIEVMEATDPLFILYTSGSTGKPKGVVHGSAGYLLYVAISFEFIFNYQSGHVHWCTADIGWITGHSYVVYGPLANGATSLIFEGVPHYPDFSRYWQIIDKHQVNIFYTAPTALRALRHEGDSWVKQSERSSLRLLGSVGEPINPEVWQWYHDIVGEGRCPIVDTWWQTETGGILISPLPGEKPLVPGSAGWPFFGIVPALVDEQGHATKKTGQLIIKKPWPGLMQSIYKDHQRFIDTYFKPVPGAYFTGDGAQQAKEGYFTLSGRIDDVIKVSGHRLGTEELESAFLSHPSVSEAAVVGLPDEITGEKICAFIIIKANLRPDDALKNELTRHIEKTIGSISKPKLIYWVTDLPKTRSGKIMRRILRKLACNEKDLGDLSTLADPEVIKKILCTSTL